MLAETEYQTLKIKCVPIPFPVRFVLPHEIKDSMALTQVKAISGTFTLRFYTPPTMGDLIEFRGHVWHITGLHHQCQIKGSPNPDRLPTVLTQYLREA